MRFWKKLKSLFSEPKAEVRYWEEDLKKRFFNLLELVTANNQALEVMAELENIAITSRPVSLNYLRSKCTTLTINVYRMICSLNAISQGKFRELEEVFQRLSERLEETLSTKKVELRKISVMDLRDVTAGDKILVGHKMGILGELKNLLGIRVPEGFVVTSYACQQFLQYNHLEEEIDRLITIADTLDDLESLFKIAVKIGLLIRRGQFPEEIQEEIRGACLRLRDELGGQTLQFAVRSSAYGEDTLEASFAGQFKTLLQISEEELFYAIREVIASKYDPSAVIYRVQKGLSDRDVLMAVGCLMMIKPKVSGVLFTREATDPESPYLEIHATFGLSESLVQGLSQGCFYRIHRETYEVFSGERFCEETPLLISEDLRNLTETALKIEEYFGYPQDIEWAIDEEGKIYILQSRPLIFSSKESTDIEVGGKATLELELLAEGGNPVYPGLVSGPAHFVRSDIDMLSFPEGGILIVNHALPKWTALLKKASGLLCERGQTASHLAIVARELELPCLFGLTNLAEKIVPGEMITLDATQGKVYRGTLGEEMGRYQATSKPQRINSPVFRILQRVIELLIPLNLTDPESINFRPANCQTFHDIIRFCHEKAVDELIEIADTFNERESPARKLLGQGAPWWFVVDLGGAFKEEGHKKIKELQVENIKSLPLRCIWEGLTFVPWEGPPIDLKGLASVFFTSTMKPELDPTMPDPGKNKNYIIASQNFCHIGVKFGFHFSVVESHLSEYTLENYIYFFFSGGGADLTRRILRLELLSEILESLQFHVITRADSLFAHIEKKPKEELIPKLRVLGYILMHFRQLDMIMANLSLVQSFKKKFSEDINALLKLGG